MKTIFYFTIYIFVLVSCSSTTEDPAPIIPEITPENINFSIDYDVDLDNTIYPSMILGLREISDEITLFTMNLTNTTDENKSVMVSINPNILVESTTITKSIQPGSNSIEFTINWNYESMKNLDQPGSANFAFSVNIDGELITTENKTLNYRSINECVYALVDSKGEVVDLKFMFAAYVNEDNPNIDGFLSSAISHSIVSSYGGYQGSPDVVLDEVFSIWYQLQKNNTQYSSITETSNSSSKVFSQNVRFFDDVLQNSSANCVDGSVFISSILLKLGIEPIIILIPGHMYMGFYTGPSKTELRVLETTLVGNVNINEINNSSNIQTYADQGYFTDDDINYYNSTCNSGNCDVEYMRQRVSAFEFINAINFRVDDYNTNQSKFNDAADKTHQVFDIKELRGTVSPIGN